MATFTRMLVPAAAVLLFAARAPAAAQENVNVFVDGRRAPWQAAIDRIAGADVVFVGENHDHSQGHALELALLQAIASRHERTALALEMFERDVQEALDEYLGGHISEQHFLSSSRPWPNYRTDYAPMVEHCKQVGLPVIAANVPRRYVNLVSRKGRAALLDLPRASRRFLPRLPYSMELSSGYDEELTRIFGGAHGGSVPAGMPSPQNMKEAQALWDAGMADAVARFARSRRGWKVMHVNGAQHSDRGYGAVERLRRASPRLKVVVVSIKPDPDWQRADPGSYAGVADVLLLTPPQPAAPPPGRGQPPR